MAKSVDSLVRRAAEAYRAGRIPEAVAAAERAIALDPNSATGYFLLGICSLSLKRSDAAVHAFDRAVQLNPELANYWLHLGMALERAGNPQQALAAYRKATELEPGTARMHVALGLLAQRLGDREQAIRSFQAALEIEPSANGYLQLADALIRSERDEEALKAIRSCLRMDPGIATAHEILGNLLDSAGEFEMAAVEFEKTVELEPTRASAHYRLVRSRHLTQADRPVVDRLSRLLSDPKLAPEQRRYAEYALGKANDDLGEYEAAIRHWDEANRLSKELQFKGLTYPKAELAATFDAMIRGFSKGLYERQVGVSDERSVFIVGMIRSGTTLVEQILSNHPKIAGGGELTFWLDPDAKLLSQQVASGQIHAIELQNLARNYQAVLDRIDPEASRITDKMPNNYMALGLIHLVFPNARIIHCRRNPVDTALSIWSTVYREPPKFAYDRENMVFAFREYERLMDHWRRVLPADRFLEIAYAELVADPETHSRRMVAFAGLEWDDACLHPEANKRLVKTPSLWQVRQPIYGSAVDRWRRYKPWLGAFRKLLD